MDCTICATKLAERNRLRQSDVRLKAVESRRESRRRRCVRPQSWSLRSSGCRSRNLEVFGRSRCRSRLVRLTLGVAGHEIAVRPDNALGTTSRWRATCGRRTRERTTPGPIPGQCSPTSKASGSGRTDAPRSRSILPHGQYAKALDHGSRRPALNQKAPFTVRPTPRQPDWLLHSRGKTVIAPSGIRAFGPAGGRGRTAIPNVGATSR